ncbi:putative nuclear factor related to kappa-B-binding protein, partial [Tanacetum coccineum]
MAADQLNKRSKVSNVAHHSSWELQKTKKTKFSHHDLNTRSSISLKWDDKKKHVVPKKEQISIARRELTPFLPCVPHRQNVLGDVFAAPSELFELNDLTDLLSYEVWQTQLSVQERVFLTQFLPEGADSNTAVHELLLGNNFYFGRVLQFVPVIVIPDAVLRQEQCNKVNKIAYYIRNCKSTIARSLQLWRETWSCCVNPENDFSQQIPRPMNEYEKNGSSHQKDIHDSPEDDVGATSDSGYVDAEDESYSSNSPDVAIMTGETSARISKIEPGNNYFDSSDGSKSVARSRKGDKLRRLSEESGDGAKYMSCIKVSKVQHERVKRMFEEERLKLQEHWSHLAKKDLPAGFANWNSWRSAKWQLGISLRKEMEDKANLNAENHETATEIEPNDQPNQCSRQNQHLPQINVIHNDSQNFCSMPMDAANDDVLIQSSAFPSSLGEYPVSINRAGQSSRPIVLESEILQKDPLGSFMHKGSDGEAFHPTVSEPMLGTNQFRRNLCPSMTMDPVLPTIQDNLYSIPRQEHLLLMNNVHNWPGNGGINLPMTSSSHHRLNQNWYHADELVHNGWSGGVVPNQDLLN